MCDIKGTTHNQHWNNDTLYNGSGDNVMHANVWFELIGG